MTSNHAIPGFRFQASADPSDPSALRCQDAPPLLKGDLVAVADGLGGRCRPTPAGPSSQRAAIATLEIVAALHRSGALDQPADGATAIDEQVRRALSELAAATPPSRLHGALAGPWFATTLTVVALRQGDHDCTFRIFQAGDSRAYLLHPNGLTMLTDDQVAGAGSGWGGDTPMTSFLSEKPGPTGRIVARAGRIAGPAMVFACSDGCFDSLPHEPFQRLILDALCSADSWESLERLVASAIRAYARDDVSMSAVAIGCRTVGELKRAMAAPERFRGRQVLVWDPPAAELAAAARPATTAPLSMIGASPRADGPSIARPPTFEPRQHPAGPRVATAAALASIALLIGVAAVSVSEAMRARASATGCPPVAVGSFAGPKGAESPEAAVFHHLDEIGGSTRSGAAVAPRQARAGRPTEIAQKAGTAGPTRTGNSAGPTAGAAVATGTAGVGPATGVATPVEAPWTTEAPWGSATNWPMEDPWPTDANPTQATGSERPAGGRSAAPHITRPDGSLAGPARPLAEPAPAPAPTARTLQRRGPDLRPEPVPPAPEPASLAALEPSPVAPWPSVTVIVDQRIAFRRKASKSLRVWPPAILVVAKTCLTTTERSCQAMLNGEIGSVRRSGIEHLLDAARAANGFDLTDLPDAPEAPEVDETGKED